jgi:hypothetical protein
MCGALPPYMLYDFMVWCLSTLKPLRDWITGRSVASVRISSSQLLGIIEVWYWVYRESYANSLGSYWCKITPINYIIIVCLKMYK